MAISRCRAREKNSILQVRHSDDFFLSIEVGDYDGRNNAIISELRRQNKNGKDAHCIRNTVFLFCKIYKLKQKKMLPTDH